MFTGIIRDIGTIAAIEETEDGARVTVTSAVTPPKTQIGSSVAINGTCLTVVDLKDDQFSFDVMPQSLRLTTLGERNVGDSVNVESSMSVGDEIGGHFLYGHVDGVATITALKEDGDALIMTIEPPEHLMTYLAPQGSVAIDGISLTVANLREKDFDISLIEHTLKETTFSDRKVGDHLNIEVDMMMKYLERIVSLKK